MGVVEALVWGVVVFHAAYLIFQMFGGLLAFRDRRWLVPHLMAVTWGIVIVVMGWPCPVTVLEKRLRTQSGTAYPESYLDHYVFGTALPNGSQSLVYGLHLVVILIIYVSLSAWWLQTRRATPARA